MHATIGADARPTRMTSNRWAALVAGLLLLGVAGCGTTTGSGSATTPVQPAAGSSAPPAVVTETVETTLTVDPSIGETSSEDASAGQTSSDDPAAGEPRSSGPAATPSSESASSPAAAEPSSHAEASATLTAPPTTGQRLDVEGFRSPSSNIACALDKASGVRCDIRDYTFPEPKVEECSMGVPNAIELSAGKPAAFVCISDTVDAPSLPTLEYGQWTKVGDVTCASDRTGVICAAGEHHFRLARDSFDLGG